MYVAILLTGSYRALCTAKTFAQALGLPSSGIIHHAVGPEQTLIVVPTGYAPDSTEEAIYDDRRTTLLERIANDEDTNTLKWVEVAYGYKNPEDNIVLSSSFHDPNHDNRPLHKFM